MISENEPDYPNMKRFETWHYSNIRVNNFFNPYHDQDRIYSISCRTPRIVPFVPTWENSW